MFTEDVESARGLTGARYGIIATVEDAGAPQGLSFSGFATKEQQESCSPGPTAPSVEVAAGCGRAHGKPNTNRLLPALGRSSGVRPVKWADVPPEPVLTATYWRPSTA